MASTNPQMRSKAIVRVVFIALVLDLLAFTLPLPLFPRIIDFYTHQESNSPNTFLAQTLRVLRGVRGYLTSAGGKNWSASGTEGGGLTGRDRKWEVVLLGGAMGSVFSICQCIISPFLGRLSDRYGRKNVLLATMIGNILSAVIWLQSTTFASYMLSRLIGGLSEGNVQISTAIISDVTTSSTRSRSLALIGIAFSICFTFGPSLGAWFASREMPLGMRSGGVGGGGGGGGGNGNGNGNGMGNMKWNVYAVPALISVILLVVETSYIYLALPETKDFKKRNAVALESSSNGNGKEIKKADAAMVKVPKESVEIRKARIVKLGRLHGLFLLLFSGAEFTLTFLTYDLFFATNRQNGMLLSYIGILSSLLQGGYVRPSLSRNKITELTLTRTGILSCSLALALMALLPIPAIKDSGYGNTLWLYTIATCLAVTSGMSVTGLTGAAAACCDEEDEGVDGKGKKVGETLPRGRALGGFRSMGQLGRAIGPLLTTSLYWTYGPTAVYGAAGVAMALLGIGMGGMVRDEKRRKGLMIGGGGKKGQ